MNRTRSTVKQGSIDDTTELLYVCDLVKATTEPYRHEGTETLNEGVGFFCWLKRRGFEIIRNDRP